ncbi:hypothetical protein IU399_29555 [Salmonella enterica subsp. enterica serovar Worthington]|nr:hypothetical protein [Salmonella enterica subsp. enterica serovar Worthington]
MKTPACSDRSGRAASVAPWPALGIPAKDRRDVGATPFRKPRFTSLRRVPARCSVRAIHLFKPLSPGAKTATTVSASPGEMHIPQNFLPRSRQKLLRSAPDSRFRPWQ